MRTRISGPRSVRGTRDEQQDSASVFSSARLGIVVVCDGVGSSPTAGICARLASAAARDHLQVFAFRHRASGPFLHATVDCVVDELRAAVADGRLDPAAQSTLAAAVVLGRMCWVLTLGDSRVTLIRGGRVIESTTPHSVSMQVASGSIAAETDRDAAWLTRWLSPDGSGGPPSILCWRVEPEDVVVVASDGIDDALPLWRMADVISRARLRLDDLSTAIMSAARASAAQDADNATVAVLEVRPRKQR
ncbi:hypothetical protein C5D09_14115 [Rathayibacter sp. AY1C9]|uniref:PP2C family protein-serine/threonine phosphatase n=1 Tax=Rathayibacter sp. AY1C9 TaxID=2080541 RepID=UPI000CE7C347|nr:protein phosphatase 2C domain-containing protein [Rathayibacter sp. AY1C9]PPH44157.1 hypothetical protein C5D09_14115 [Rathayibacter sp. AY1C9]